MDTTSNLLVDDCGVDNSVNNIISKYKINPKHLKHVINTHNGKLHIIEEAQIYEEALAQQEYDTNTLGCETRYLADSYGKNWRFVCKTEASTNAEAIDYFQPKNYWYNMRINDICSKYNQLEKYETLTITDLAECELQQEFDKYIEKYKIDNDLVNFIDKGLFVYVCTIHNVAIDENLKVNINPIDWINERYKNLIEAIKQY